MRVRKSSKLKACYLPVPGRFMFNLALESGQVITLNLHCFFYMITHLRFNQNHSILYPAGLPIFFAIVSEAYSHVLK